jgi:6-pyruvoyltetrahydropterin/6-carboxytetrahydropterin synthase
LVPAQDSEARELEGQNLQNLNCGSKCEAFTWDRASFLVRNTHDFPDAAGHIFCFALLLEPSLDRREEPAGVRKWLKDVIEREVLTAWDHRHLNLEVPEFAAIIPTTENIAIAAWKRLEPSVTRAGGAQLSRVRIYETPEIFAEYRGEA